jgi:DNA-binding MarR family transcriptional regulator
MVSANTAVLQARLTGTGASALRQAQHRVDAIHAHMLRGISPAEAEQLLSLLIRVAVTPESKPARGS